MIRMRLSELAHAIGAEHRGPDGEFSGCGTDTRTLAPGALFVALRGERFDGHGFLAEAKRRGAAAAVVERPDELGLPIIVVSDTRRALADIARLWRQRFQLPLVAVTGSNGKTTVKEMLRTVLAGRGAALATRGNLNNDIGVPLTLFGLGSEHRYAVVEMGANHAGEIAALCEMAQPTVAIVTQCAPAHLKGFGSVEGVARAKGEAFAALPQDGIAVINVDDPYASLWRALAGPRRVLSFGLLNPAEVTATIEDASQVVDGSRLRLHLPETASVEVHLPLPGRHNVMNALAASACAWALGLSAQEIAAGLGSLHEVPGRLQSRAGRNGVRLFDDSYNANPGSLCAALEVLAECPGERWLVMGDMAELGPEAWRYHHEVGVQAQRLGIARLYAIGTLCRESVDGFGSGGIHFENMSALLESLRSALHPNVTLLVKGSRFMRMERVVEFLAADGEPRCS